MRSFENYRFRLSHKNRTAEKIKRAQFGIELHSFNDSFFPIKPFPQHNIIFNWHHSVGHNFFHNIFKETPTSTTIHPIDKKRHEASQSFSFKRTS